MAETDSKLFGKYHELILLLLGFVLTSFVGGYLTYTWQLRAQEFQQETDHRRVEQEAASKLFEEISRLMDKRLYRMRRIHTGQTDPNVTKDMPARHEAYQVALFEWNENLNRNLALTQRYFGDDARTILEHTITTKFRKLGEILDGGAYPPDTSNKFQYRQKLADDLNVDIYNFDVHLIQAIQHGNVGDYLEASK